MIKFGTSGFRGILGDNFTKENVERIAYALKQVILENDKTCTKIYIGYDNRFMGKEFAKYVASVLCTDFKIYIYNQSVPSPLISYCTKNGGYGVVITASHNPFNYNGVKIFLPKSRECDDSFALKVETIANNVDYKLIESKNYINEVIKKQIIETSEIMPYLISILGMVDVSAIRQSNLKILANVMHGNGGECLEYLFRYLKLNYEIMNSDIDPYFEGKLPAPYVYNLSDQAKRVKKEKFDLGIALDGDSDRISIIDKTGEIYDCNYVVSVLYSYYLTYKGKTGSVIKNYALSDLIKKITKAKNFNCYESKVGFKQIAPLLLTTDAIMGAESNGIAVKEHICSKDGIQVGIAIIDSMAITKKSFKQQLNDLQKEYNFKSVIKEFAYPISFQDKDNILNLLFEEKKYPDFNNYKILSVYDEEGCKITYENGYWIMVRFSGNEPVVRIFCEMQNDEECDKAIKCFENYLGLKIRQA